MLSRANLGPLRASLFGATAVIAFLLATVSAFAVNARVKAACQSDYFRHCSAHALGSAALRQCMQNVGPGLSTPCIVALVEEGEITKADIARFQATLDDGAKAEKPATPSGNNNVGSSAKAQEKVQDPGKTSKTAATVKSAKVGPAGKSSKVASVDKTAAASGKTAKNSSAAKTDKTDAAGKSSKVASVDKMVKKASQSVTNTAKSKKAAASKTADPR
jgi:adenylate kinase